VRIGGLYFEAAALTDVSGDGPEGVSYVSYPPGSFPGADSLGVRNVTRGLTVGAAFMDGGVDPIPVPSSVGDTLQITVTGSAGAEVFEDITRVIPDEEPPIIVRTDPRRRRTRVPLNARVAIVFSEPVDPSTITPESIGLYLGNNRIPAALSVSDDLLQVEVKPQHKLELAKTYAIQVGLGLMDLAGSRIQEEFRSEFTTTEEVGSIMVVTNTIGAEGDESEGYSILVDSVPEALIGAQDTVVVTDVAVGIRNVGLAGLGTGCSALEWPVLVQANGLEVVPITVRCSRVSLELSVETEGDPEVWDPDGFHILLDNDWTFSVGFNSTQTLLLTGEGERVFYLSGIDPPCASKGENPRTLNLQVGIPARTTFEVYCPEKPG
jgi:hypothetical protein